MITLLFATKLEAEQTLKRKDFRLIDENHYRFQDIDLILTGVGKVNAAVKASLACNSQTNLLINAGIVGAINPTIKLFDVLSPTSICDLDRMEGKLANQPIHLEEGSGLILGTTDIPLHGDHRRALYQGKIDIIDMEGYSVATTAKNFQKKVKFFKCVSDFCEENGSKEILKNLPKASELLANSLMSFLNSPSL